MYNYFALHYDELTENVDYKVRSEYISGFFNKYGISKDDTVLDLACGTGTMSLLFKEQGYQVIGVDLSSEMLSIADNKANGDISFIKAEMQNFELSKPVDACICCLDSLNHLHSLEEVNKTFECVYNSLNENGIFIFDVNTIYKHRNVLANNTFVFDEENYFLSWDNELIDDYSVRILLDFFVFNGNSYDRYSEEFAETAFETEDLSASLSPYFEVLGIYDDMTLEKPKKDSERLYFVCKRK
ncbi:MAG: methyltransferase domain-containing protein [Eubacterium sp.]|nr:methyltransferase domain-containing protein [Eubacterium sp.]